MKENQATAQELHEKEQFKNTYSNPANIRRALNPMCGENDSLVVREERENGNGYEYSITETGKERLDELEKNKIRKKEEKYEGLSWKEARKELLSYLQYCREEERDINPLDEARNSGQASLSIPDIAINSSLKLANYIRRTPSKLEKIEDAITEFDGVDEDVQVRISEIAEEDTYPVGQISAKVIGNFVGVTGNVKQVGNSDPVRDSGIFECLSCGTRYEKAQDSKKVKSPYKCQDCGSRKFKKKKIEHANVRTLILEAPPSFPTRDELEVVLEKDDVFHKPYLDTLGEQVKVVGEMVEEETNSKDATVKMKLKSHGLETESNSYIEEITEEEEQRIQEVNERDDKIEYLASSISKDALTDHIIKEAVLVWCVGKTKFGNTHLLTVGEPGTVKTALVSPLVEHILPASHMTEGGQATSAGMTVSAEKDERKGGFIINPGALVKFDYHITDEADKMNTKVFEAYNKPLSDQVVQPSKGGINAKMKTSVSELTIANPEGKKFRSPDRYEQLPFSDVDDTFSRYTLRIGIAEEDTPEEKEMEIAEHILKRDDSEYLEEKGWLDSNLLRKYLMRARETETELTEDAIEEALELYDKLKDELQGRSFSIRRELVHLKTLSAAYAKLDLSEEITSEHMKQAARIKGEALASLGIHIGKNYREAVDGQFQFQEDLTQKENQVIQKVAAYEELEETGISDEKLVEYLNWGGSDSKQYKKLAEVTENLAEKGKLVETKNSNWKTKSL